MMSLQDYKNNSDIKFALSWLESKTKHMRANRDDEHWLSPQLEQIQHEISLIESAIKKIKDHWSML